MHLSSPKITFDNRLLAIEEQFRQRKYGPALHDLHQLKAGEFEARAHEHGLHLLLLAEGNFFKGNYKKAIEAGLGAAKILADFPLNRRYGRIQLVLSKAYYALGDLRNAEIRARDALAAYRRASDNSGQVDSLNQLAGIAHMRCSYKSAVAFLEEALEKASDDPRKVVQLTGNLGRTRIRIGEWVKAEEDLTAAIEHNRENNEEASLAMNLLSLGLLRLRRRQFILAGHSLDEALEIISRLDLKRERIIYAEYAGELAFEKGDTFKAKSTLGDAYQKGLLLAPSSALVSQSARRLAEVELSLDNFDEAMKYGQKALELSLMLGEKLEIGLSRSVIARVFVAQSDFNAALDHIGQAVEVLKEVGDPYELGRTLLVMADISMVASPAQHDKARTALDAAHRLFRKLKLGYWTAEADFKAGIFACQQGDLARGFKKLSRAERVFSSLEANVKVRAVSKFLRSLSDQAVALSISDENEFKIFGNLVTPAEYSDLKSSEMDTILEVLKRKCGGHRALIYMPDAEENSVVSSFPLAQNQARKFADSFQGLLGEEVSRTKPTLILDCRRDPFVNGLFTETPEVVCSVIVVPFRTSDGDTSYLYLDRLSVDNCLNPFNQTELNFAVGFTDLIAFKWAEILKNKLLEDNLRLKTQLQKQTAFPNIITRNIEMQQMLAQVRQVINSSISISIEGETGSGKDLLARAIHYNSNRRDKRFISVNCAALPESLLESELFGYKRGAFTGADRDKSGLFEEADGGTFLLDEIADMPLSIQAKVLRILEEKEIVRLGDTIPRKVDVRIVSATNKDLKVLMDTGQFRHDLYYRLTAMTFRIPPLRERKEDIPLLVSHFMQDDGREITADIMKLILAYDWPGNIRELENEVKKMVLLSGGNSQIDMDVVSQKLLAEGSSGNGSGGGNPPAFDEVVFDTQYSLYDYLAEHEKRFLIRALREKRGVKKHAAAHLNIPESTLRLKIKQYKIDLDQLSSNC